VLRNKCQKDGFKVRELVAGARVPVLKLSLGTDECDLTINNLLPVYNTQLLKAYTLLDPELVPLVQAMKDWAKAQGCHCAADGHLSSYSFTLLCLFYDQVKRGLPSVQAKAEGKEEYTDSTQNRTFQVAMAAADASAVQEAMAEFDYEADLSVAGLCHFYVNEFVWGEDVVSVRLGTQEKVSEFPKLKKEYPYMPASEAKYMIHIEDPIDVERNLNCVLNPGNVIKLYEAMKAEAEKRVKAKPRTPAQEVARQQRAVKRAEKKTVWSAKTNGAAASR